eukprot:TRINITY_DN9879_c0_g1_i1.p2 TRINITY_DN9879_c0_g1~~TRINITY_DN9879_c0_g1_i1.p2  ORF type:complete len:206 (-),score=62.06 TRINITY_DN9879_c0_g1_i1:212-829(-)
MHGLAIRSRPHKGEKPILTEDHTDMLKLYSSIAKEAGCDKGASAAVRAPFPVTTALKPTQPDTHEVLLEGLFYSVSYTLDGSVLVLTADRRVPTGAMPPSGEYTARIPLPTAHDPSRTIVCVKKGGLLGQWVVTVPLMPRSDTAGEAGCEDAAAYAALLGLGEGKQKDDSENDDDDADLGEKDDSDDDGSYDQKLVFAGDEQREL